MGYHSRSRSPIKRGPASSGNQHSSTGKSILVKNLNFKTNADGLKRDFERFGDIKDVYIPLDYRSQRAKGFGFIEFYHSEDAHNAVADMDQARIEGNTVHVCIAQNRRKSPTAMRHRDNRDGGRGHRSPSPYRRRRSPPRRGRSSSRSRSKSRDNRRAKSRKSSRSDSRK